MRYSRLNRIRVRAGREVAPWMAAEIQRLEALLDRAYAEIRKQTFASRVVFDREIVEEADKHNPDVQPRPGPEG